MKSIFSLTEDAATWVDILLRGLVGDTQGFPGGSDNNLPAMREARVRSLGQENLLEKETATLSGILAYRITWSEETGGLRSVGSPRVGHD